MPTPNSVKLQFDVETQNLRGLDSINTKLDRMGKEFKGLPRTAKPVGKGLGDLKVGALAAAAAVGSIVSKLVDFGKDALGAAAQMEGLKKGLSRVIPDAATFEKTLSAIDKTARLPGLQKADLVKFTTRLMAAGVSGENTQKILTNVGAGIVSMGGTAAQAGSTMEQLAQAFGRGKIEAGEFNRLTSEMTGLKEIIGQMTGGITEAEDLNKALAAQGKTLDSVLVPALEEWSARYGEVDESLANTKVDAFNQSIDDLKETIGARLLPIFKRLIDRTIPIIDKFAGLVKGGDKVKGAFTAVKGAFNEVFKALKPFEAPLKNLSETLLPALKVAWDAIVKIFRDAVIPIVAKVITTFAPINTALVTLATSVINLTQTYLPPLVTAFTSVAGVVKDVVLWPIEQVVKVLGWIIGKVNDLIKLIPGAKGKLTELADEAGAVATETGKMVTQTEAATTALTTQAPVADAAKTSADKLAGALKDVKEKEEALKTAVVAANAELDTAKTKLAESSDPTEVQANLDIVIAKINAVKAAEIAKSGSLETESEKQRAILRANTTAATAVSDAHETAKGLIVQHQEAITAKLQKEADDRELTLETEIGAIQRVVTNEGLALRTRDAANIAFKDAHKRLLDERLKNIAASDASEAEKTAARVQAHADYNEAIRSGDESLRTTRDQISKEIAADAKTNEALRVQALKDANTTALDATKAHLILMEGEFKRSADDSLTEQEVAYNNLVSAMKAHHAAEIKAEEAQGKDTAVLKAKQKDALLELADKFWGEIERKQKESHAAQIEEMKAYGASITQTTRDINNRVEQPTVQSAQTMKGALLDFGDTAKTQWGNYGDIVVDVLEDIGDAMTAHEDGIKAVTQITKEGLEARAEVTKTFYEKQNELLVDFYKQQQELATELKQLYKNVRADIDEELKGHRERVQAIDNAFMKALAQNHRDWTAAYKLADAEFNTAVYDANKTAYEALEDLGVQYYRGMTDKRLNFHREMTAIEDKAQTDREHAAKLHTKRLKEIETGRDKNLRGVSRDFFKETLKSFDDFYNKIGEGTGDAQSKGLTNLRRSLSQSVQGLLKGVVGDEFEELFSVTDNFNIFSALGTDVSKLTTHGDFLNLIQTQLPALVGQIRGGRFLTGLDSRIGGFAKSIASGISVNDRTGGILGGARQSVVAESNRYMDALASIEEWKVEATEVILDTKGKLIDAESQKTLAQAMADNVKTTLDAAVNADWKKALRDNQKVTNAATGLIVNTYDSAVKAINEKQWALSDELRTQLNTLTTQFVTDLLRIDKETQAAIKRAQEESSRKFWDSIIKIGGTVLGTAAGAVIGSFAGNPVVGAQLGAQLGGGGADLINKARAGNDEGFHSAINDQLAYLAGQRSGERAGRKNWYRENAADFAHHFGKGFEAGMPAPTMQQQNTTPVIVEVHGIGDEIIRAIGKRQTELAAQGTIFVPGGV